MGITSSHPLSSDRQVPVTSLLLTARPDRGRMAGRAKHGFRLGFQKKMNGAILIRGFDVFHLPKFKSVV